MGRKRIWSTGKMVLRASSSLPWWTRRSSISSFPSIWGIGVTISRGKGGSRSERIKDFNDMLVFALRNKIFSAHTKIAAHASTQHH